MDDRSQVLANVFVGILLGGALGYLCLTKDGRRILSRVEPWLDDVIERMRELQSSAAKARETVIEGKQSFDALL
ncbi:MAG TPA: hypothetical protein VH701_00415, partial [Vicinamibacterales bacterium]